jgi:DNA-3-methyladenine glycosylase I
MNRCGWADCNKLMQKYHDEEWGAPLHDDQKLFEFLTLEGAQAGLSWNTILKRREGYRKAFDNFDIKKIIRYSDKKLEKLMTNSDIIKNKLKIKSVINNSKSFLKIQKEFGSFDNYIWKFVDYKPIKNKFKTLKEIPAETELSRVISKDLKKRGFTFVGPTICYAFMQAVGMVNDHVKTCFKFEE